MGRHRGQFSGVGPTCCSEACRLSASASAASAASLSARASHTRSVRASASASTSLRAPSAAATARSAAAAAARTACSSSCSPSDVSSVMVPLSAKGRERHTERERASTDSEGQLWKPAVDSCAQLAPS